MDKILNDTHFDTRAPERIEIPILTIVLGSMMSALTGRTGCTEISEAINNRLQSYFKEHMPELVVDKISHDTIRNTLMLVDTERFDSFYSQVLSMMPRLSPQIIAADGQAVRATGITDSAKPTLHNPRMLMGFYDATNRVCLAHVLIDKKENEIKVGPDALRSLNIQGAVVTADAMSCQVKFVEAALSRGAHYCISLKGNQDKSFEEVRYLFNSTPEDRMVNYAEEVRCEHGRIEDNRVSLLRGTMLSLVIKDKWQGLEGGSLIRIVRTCTKKTTGAESVDERFFISSIAPSVDAAPRLAEVVRMHWSIENRLHWLLDMRFNQDRMQANDPAYIANRSALNKLALAFLEQYNFWLWNTKREKSPLSINLLQQRCQDPAVAMECLACGMGILG